MAFYRLGLLKRICSNGRTAQSKKVLCQTTKRTFAFTSTFFRPNFLSTKLFETKINVNKDSDLSMELAKYAVNFLNSKQFISSEVYDRAKLFHTDAVLCGIAAISLKAKSPTILRESNLLYYSNFSQKPENTRVAKMFGLNKYTNIEKAVAANVSATHDLNSNGFSLGFANDDPTRTSLGEVSNNSYYPVVIAAAHVNSKIDGLKALKAMILLDEIRGRLNESFDINEYHVDNDLFGGIASTIVYGALLKATPEQISEAINLYIGNYTPWRAIKTGMYELADSAECCPSFTCEMGITCMNRVLDNYQVENIQLPSHNLTLRTSGDKFSIMGMHFRFGCYSALSSGAIYSLINILLENPEIFEKYDYKDIVNIRVRTFSKAYEMAGKLPRSDAPVSRQAAIYSIQYLIGRITFQDVYSKLVLGPLDFTRKALLDDTTCLIMSKVDVIDGGDEFNIHYPEGLPTSVSIYFNDGKRYISGMTKFPCGHSNNKTVDTNLMLLNKFSIFGGLGLANKDLINFIVKLQNINEMDNEELTNIYNCKINIQKYESIDD